MEGEFFEKINIKGMEFDVIQSKSNNAIEHLRDVLRSQGYQVYFSAFNDNSKELNSISIIKTIDELDIIRFNSVNGINHNIFPNDIIENIKKWNELYGLDITGANNDWIMFRLNSLPDELEAYVNELIEFCPDYLHQDNYSERGVEWSKFLIKGWIFYHKIIRLWWD